MSEIAVPQSFSIPENTSMADSVFRHEKESPEFVPFERLVDGKWVPVTARQFASEVRAVAKGLMASGIELGDRVAVLSATRYEWVLLDYAIWTAGGATVAIYETSSADQAQWILEDSGTKLLIVENSGHVDTVREVAENAPTVREVLQIEPAPGGKSAVDELIARGAAVTDEQVEERRNSVTAESAATLIYTSGTTGRPKGVQLKHRHFASESAACGLALPDSMHEGQRTLLFIPMAHVFARLISFAAFDSKVTVGHTSDLSTLLDQFAVFKPNFILSVPRVFEKVYNSAKQKAYDGGKGKIFEKASDVAIEYSKALENGGPGLALKIQHFVFDKLVYGKLKAALGGNVTRAVSGGAALGGRLGHFFRGVGVTIYEGYGLTETTGGIIMNTPAAQKIGTVGKPFNGCAAKIAEDGELLLKGPQVFDGYWQNDKATDEAIRDGWFHTGDIGAIDEDGFISITGRKKELIVTAGGKNVAPAVLEDSLRAHPLISQVIVVGDSKPFVGALITLDPEALPGWLERHSLPAGTTVAELIKNPDLIAEIDEAVAETNKKVSKAESIRKYRILETDFSIESGELTPTLKLKRNIIHDKHGAEIAAIYN
ncbi:long-chain acyl-CoA synthetase [Rhodococcus rhodochrous J3]|uniref:Acyl-CoA synthetase n=2 Tax=Rhodococcus rhodochrous TaxID=1829 RepID=A0AA46X016_RHORH|nr:MULTISPECIES: long-chain fatty acid--CoA ligase [Rhodococcus]MBF4477266.1 long-chain fatty acid--CoA ligase [Rhodococcus rhodochrous]MCB8912581.1 long-chain fatty acid--CoA ligase [Rhodococcus rhodochrous]MDC3728897.1 long-chain fatty acid--CoA ligase [Rhodococcus sp. Rp3]MDJ0400981.1 long-chain fatty acid--CoA ligase [Rhodococcus rhodochrous]TWH52735.1 long-chain acyl-CoA synthetase [Rhodococcus rhodochrous J38]